MSLPRASLAPILPQRLVLTALLCAFTTLAAACMPVHDVDARFAAGWRPTRGYCAFGAETHQLAAWCAEVNFGEEGLLAVARAVNQQVLATGGRSLPCTEHVAAARRRLAEYPDYTVTDVYSCDAEPMFDDGRAVCHVSLLVTSASGKRVVLDNGHVLEPATTSGVAPYAQFAASVDRHWMGALATAAPNAGASGRPR